MSLVKNIIKKAFGFKELKFHVAGVTFMNGRKHRQTILRKIRYGDSPYENAIKKVTFERYDYEGSLAIGVYVAGEQIGNVPVELVDDFDKAWTGEYLIESLDIVGRDPLGCEIKVLFNK